MGRRFLNIGVVVGVTGLVVGLMALPLLAAAFISREAVRRVRGFFFTLWARTLLRGLGARLTVKGTPPPKETRPLHFVSNHLSYLDIPVLAAVRPLTFVSKDEVARWPVIGVLTRMMGTIFVDRTRPLASGGLVDLLAAELAPGGETLVFPEGTSTDGERLLPFKTSLFEAPVRVGAHVQTMIIRYKGFRNRPLDPESRDAVCWYADMEFAPHAWEFAARRGLRVEVEYGPLIAPGPRRKELASAARTALAGRFRPLI